jgi:hypothetical protein
MLEEELGGSGEILERGHIARKALSESENFYAEH